MIHNFSLYALRKLLVSDMVYCTLTYTTPFLRSYGKPFVDLYMRIIKAAYDKRDDEILKYGI